MHRGHTSATMVLLGASGNTAHHSLGCDFDPLIEVNKNAVWGLGLLHLMARPLNKKPNLNRQTAVVMHIPPHTHFPYSLPLRLCLSPSSFSFPLFLRKPINPTVAFRARPPARKQRSYLHVEGGGGGGGGRQGLSNSGGPWILCMVFWHSPNLSIQQYIEIISVSTCNQVLAKVNFCF